MATKALIPFLVAMMLVTGVCNTLLTKYQVNISPRCISNSFLFISLPVPNILQDMQCVRDCDNPNPKKRHNFEQPVWQTAQMFVGEMGCWLVVGCYSIFNRFIAPRFASAGPKYSAIASEDTQDDDADEGYEEDGLDQSTNSFIANSLIPSDGRVPLVGWKVILLGLPAVCDICGTTLMNVGLLFVAASIYQMTRGALVLFVGVFSVIFLKRRLFAYQWFALISVVLGVGLVGLAGALWNSNKIKTPDGSEQSVPHVLLLLLRRASDEVEATARDAEALRTILGVFLIAFAQIFTATQFVLEEWILENYALEALKVVGWEGTFGLLVTVIGMIILHFTVGVSPAGQGGYFDAVQGWYEVTHFRAIGISSLAIMVSIG
jgi:drug/metabolite transporter (DMT)-like permease